MPASILQKSQTIATQLLTQTGLKLHQIPQAIQIARETVEQWLEKERINGNTLHLLQVLKGHLQEKGPQLVFAKLKDVVLVRLMLHLGIRSALATNIATLILPFILKKVYDKARENPKVQAWWNEQNWRQKLPGF